MWVLVFFCVFSDSGVLLCCVCCVCCVRCVCVSMYNQRCLRVRSAWVLGTDTAAGGAPPTGCPRRNTRVSEEVEGFLLELNLFFYLQVFGKSLGTSGT